MGFLKLASRSKVIRQGETKYVCQTYNHRKVRSYPVFYTQNILYVQTKFKDWYQLGFLGEKQKLFCNGLSFEISGVSKILVSCFFPYFGSVKRKFGAIMENYLYFGMCSVEFEFR